MKLATRPWRLTQSTQTLDARSAERETCNLLMHEPPEGTVTNCFPPHRPTLKRRPMVKGRSCDLDGLGRLIDRRSLLPPHLAWLQPSYATGGPRSTPCRRSGRPHLWLRADRHSRTQAEASLTGRARSLQLRKWRPPFSDQP